jgi:predicted metalloprotease
MRIRRSVDTSQIEDRRGLSPTAIGGGGIGVVGLVIYLLVTLLGGGSATSALFPVNQLPGPAAAGSGEPLNCTNGADTNDACFVAAVVNDVQDTWRRQFASQGRHYTPTKLVLFTGSTPSGCGQASSATGPFYCPADAKVYLDLGFFRELRTRFGAPGDFAQAYVVAHEFGHHVQDLLGTSDRVSRAQARNNSEANALSVRLELQADCYAGVWAHNTTAQLDPGDFKEGIDAAAAVGDDRLQREAGVRVNPETWTHGSSAERVSWFERGAQRGEPADCDTFAASSP